LGQSAPVHSAELEAELPCVLVEALPLALPEAEAPELGDAGVVLPPLEPAEVLPAPLPLCAQAVASMAATTATPIAFNAI
jgi:hypothetical protein